MNTYTNLVPPIPELARLCQDIDRRLLDLSKQYGPSTVAIDYTFKNSDTIDSLQVSAATGNRIVTLSSPTGNRRRRVIKTDATVNTVTVTGATATATINGTATVILAAQYAYVTVEPTGTNWLIVS